MGVVSYTVVNGEIIAEKRNGVRSLYSPDPLGSTVALFDATQTKTDTWVFWPYGEVKTRTGATGTPFQFVGTFGYYRDSSVKTYVRARYLDTAKGRWLTEDPIRFESGEFNMYAYCSECPTSVVDPSGNAACNDFVVTCTPIGVGPQCQAAKRYWKGYVYCRDGGPAGCCEYRVLLKLVTPKPTAPPGTICRHSCIGFVKTFGPYPGWKCKNNGCWPGIGSAPPTLPKL